MRALLALLLVGCQVNAPGPLDPCTRACATLKALGCSWAPEATCMAVCHEPGYPAACVAEKQSCEVAARCR